jgi:RimJ/RimL family protein N-acetyltransferase
MHYIFDLSKEYVLENDCVLLRPLQVQDCDNLRYFSLNEPEIWTYSLQKAAGEMNLKKYVEFAVQAREKGTEYPFIVFDKKKQAYAGSTRFYDIQLHHQTLQLGFTWYGKEFQGTGLNKHCKFLLLQFAFEQIEMERVEFRADINNARSIAAMKSIGCVEEGVLRSHANKIEGGRRDSIVLSILKDEWFNHVKAHLQQKL